MITARSQGDANEPPGESTAVTSPLEITHGEMNAAIDQGHAVPLSHSQGWLIRYRDDWWIEWENGWLGVTDDNATRDLDMIAERLAAVGEVAAHDAAERVAAGKGGTEDGDQAADVKRRISGLAPVARRTSQESQTVPGNGGGNRPAS
jgi:hypothetical protein